jgi:DNA-directed RNA polymerase specialized sigma24 family protein
MNLKHDLTVPEADRLRALCNFSDEERKVFDLRIRDKSVVEISMALSMSVASTKRRLCSIRTKIAKVSQI